MKYHIFAATAALLSVSSCCFAQEITPYPVSGKVLWFDTPTSSTEGVEIWKINDFSGTITNPDPAWETKSLPIGNGSFGGTILGSVNRERIVLNEKTLWKGGPGTGAEQYWDMNKNVDPATLSTIRKHLVNGDADKADYIVRRTYNGTTPYDRTRFGTFTVMGEAYISTGIDENSVTDYKRLLDIANSLVVVEFNSDGSKYQRRYFCSYPDSVMVWQFTSDNKPQHLTFSFNCPQIVDSITAEADGLLYSGHLEGNNMKWALKVIARTTDGKPIKTDAKSGTISVDGSRNVEFILSGDTDYVINFNPDFTDAKTYAGTDPVKNVSTNIANASTKTYQQLYAKHLHDYKTLFDRVNISINPQTERDNVTTPDRLARFRQTDICDPLLEEMYFDFGRYLLISSSRQGNMPANLQGLWHNNTDGPWRVDYHNNINLQMNYWPANSTNLTECFAPFIDYVRSLIKPGEATAKAYYDARGWTAEVSTNIFGFTAPLSPEDMSWNYNPTAGPWLTTQIWEYFDYTRDKEWLRQIGYPIIKASADFVSDLLYKHNGYYTSAPSYSPEHGPCDIGATYANAVTREVLDEAIKAAKLLDVDAESVAEWQEKLDNMTPYKIGRYGQLQEWYEDIDTYNDPHRHTNHLFGLHPGSSINALRDTALVAACKETLNQRGDAATGWSMGWKLNHWARLLDGDHAYKLYSNLLKNGTADNLWDLHPPFQIDGNFGGTAGVAELFLQSHGDMLHLLPALPSAWTHGHITGLRARGGFEVDIYYNNNALDYAIVTSLAGEPCTIYYAGHTLNLPASKGSQYKITFDPDTSSLSASPD